MSNELENRTIAILLAPRGTEQVEFERPKQAIEAAGGRIEVIGLEIGEASTVNGDLEPGDTFMVDRAFVDASIADYDGLVIPGGTVGSDTLRADHDAVRFIAGFFEQDKPVAAICHGPWTLVEAGVVHGRTLTSFPSLQTDIRNAGGTWIDQDVVTGDGLTTSRSPDDLDAFCARIVEDFAAAGPREQARSA